MSLYGTAAQVSEILTRCEKKLLLFTPNSFLEGVAEDANPYPIVCGSKIWRAPLLTTPQICGHGKGIGKGSLGGVHFLLSYSVILSPV